jgi:ornithine decarboxylase
LSNSKLIEAAKNVTVTGPTVLLDLDQIEKNYDEFVRGMPGAFVHYAVKANPNPAILGRLHDLGCRFDAASRGEIHRLLALGVDPSHISFGNTIKKPSDIEWSYRHGIDLFAADSEMELEKIAQYAPGSRVFIRMLVRSTEAEWPLSRKFGCSTSYIIPLLQLAASLGLKPVGLSFHVGSQTRHPYMWDDTLGLVAAVWSNAREEGFDLHLLNVGGGFPAYYGVDITDPAEYGAYIADAIHSRFEGVTYLMTEPGRGLVGNAGVMVAEVLLVSHKNPEDELRWVYLDVGKFSGLSETIDEAIKYQFVVFGRENEETSECVLAGPTCDSADVLYEINKVQLPVGLDVGDRFVILSTGAYTTTYSTVWFNGFEPLQELII